jgi:hypothetical protein
MVLLKTNQSHMQRFILFLMIILLSGLAVQAQKVNSYPVVVCFNSMCCGVPGEAPLINLVNRFKKQYRIRRMAAEQIGPMGREGEYYLAFRLQELRGVQKTRFIQQLKKLAPTMIDKGSVDIKENLLIKRSDLSPSVTISTRFL